MEPLDIYALRETFNRNRILLCFNGPFTATLIEEIGSALREHLQALQASPSSVADVFAVYIEMTQNIRRYTLEQQLQEQAATSTLIVSRNTHDNYVVSSGNIVKLAHGTALIQRVEELAEMDKPALKAAFKAQLRQPRESLDQDSAGLGLIDIARKATQPLAAFIRPVDAQHAFFSLHAVL